MFKNVASQKLTVFAYDATTNLPKTGDAANLTAYVDKDDGGVTVLADTSATEKDATNAKGYYIFDLAQAETNADKLLFTCKSSTANIVVIAVPAVVYTLPTTGILAPTTAGRTLDVSAGGEAGIDWANVGSPTTTLALTGTTIASTQKVDVETIKTQTVTCAAGVTVLASVGTAATSTAQTGDSYAIVSSGTHGNAALKTLIDAVDNFVDTEIADIQARLPAALTSGGRMKASLEAILDTVPTEGASGRLAGAFTTLFDVASPVLTAASVNQTGDSYARIGATGSGLTSLAPSATALSTAQWTNARAGYLDNINNSNLASVPAFPSNFSSLGINASGHVSRVTLTDTTTTNTDMITAAGIRAAVGLASANLDTQLGAIDDYIDTEIASLVSSVGSIWTTALTEAYRADGATGTGAQLLYELLAHHNEANISGTTKTTKKIDGSTTAAQYTLDSSTAPTAITRSA